jgi:hypothetical protein
VIRYLRALLVASLLAFGLTVGTASPAAALCLPPPQVSQHAFVGRVFLTSWDGRLAWVWTGRGRLVIVQGGSDPEVPTSIDRSFQAGVRYEFHPLNDRSPYQDNLCTATRPLP